MTLLTLSSVAKSYGSVAAVAGVDLAAQSGSRTAIVGPSGCGKTTLLRLIAGFEVPDAGSITLGGEIMSNADAHVAAYRRNIGIVAQDGCLFPHLSVLDNIGFGMDADRDAKQARAAELMEMVGLDGAMLARKPDQLSGGQQQRVALARALARRPRLMLLDEPFSALDMGLRTATRKAVAAVLSAAGVTTILVTHDQAEALAFADELVVMRAGKFAQVGTPREVYLKPVDRATATFLGEAVVLPAMVSDGIADSPIGRLEVADVTYRGRAQIMIRPEQFTVSRIEYAPDNGVSAVVSDVVFCGPSLDARITLAGDGIAEGEISFRLDIPGRELLASGDRVSIGISGRVHLLADG
ncbi:ABC transporter ATP-binding protein [Rhizobium sp. CFBP 13726]|uniref:ABC transporter ATP-binding protein n=1 Tax=Rhizobium sp. CFBP 13726 TaxID=2775296 RepID=UPI0017835925|nr:ABC transporter ATP-binding protein [Rhizobium sp. CFBP 13726]MBD8651640.1 ABC transporter ATP-binding protein [Rhizobium sp. CFBP 13726]